VWADVFEDIKAFLRYPNHGDGGFGIRGCGGDAASPKTKRGELKRVSCIRGEPKTKTGLGCSCKWGAVYEDSVEGWVLKSWSKVLHNHDLFSSRAEVHARGSGRHIPEALVEQGKLLAEAGQSAGEIMKVFDSLAKKKHLLVTWTYKDVFDSFVPSAATKALDATNLVGYLEQRTVDNGLHHHFTVDADGKLNQLFVELNGAFEEYALSGADNVVLFDPTHGTSRYALKLCCFTTVSTTGLTVILAVAFLEAESVECFEWAFRCFMQVFKVSPLSFFTDGDSSIEIAVTNLILSGIWTVEHQLCIFHVSKNMYQHLRPLVHDVKAWKKLHNLFWKIAKDSDDRSRIRFAQEWADFADALREVGSGPTLAREVEWVEALGAKAEKWAARYVWSRCTFTVHSTQRAEAVQSAVKEKIVQAKGLLTDLILQIEDYSMNTQQQRTADSINTAMRNASKATTLPLVVTNMLPKLTAFAGDCQPVSHT
jgi:hypothetical protein